MNYRNPVTTAGLLIGLTILAAPGATASIILAGIGAGSGTATIIVNTPAAGNNNVLGQSPNTVNIFENLTGNTFGVAFFMIPNAPSTEYFVTKTVTNNTGLPWTSFSMFVGCNGSPCSPSQDPLTFDYDQAPTSTAGGTLNIIDQYGFTWTGLNIPASSSVTFTFSVDTCPTCQGGSLLQVAQNGNVPEPGTILMGSTGLALIAIGSIRRRRSGEPPNG